MVLSYMYSIFVKLFGRGFEFNHFKDKLRKLDRKRDKEHLKFFREQFFRNKLNFTDKPIKYLLYFIGAFFFGLLEIIKLQSKDGIIKTDIAGYPFVWVLIFGLIIIIVATRLVKGYFFNQSERDLNQYLQFILGKKAEEHKEEKNKIQTRDKFWYGISIGFAGGLLGNIYVTTYYRWVDKPDSMGLLITALLSTSLLLGFMWFLSRKIVSEK